jgi:hypothetical protein
VALEPDLFTMYLYENYPEFCDDIDVCTDTAAYQSMADQFLGNWEVSFVTGK